MRTLYRTHTCRVLIDPYCTDHHIDPDNLVIFFLLTLIWTRYFHTHTHLHFAAGKHSFTHKYWCSFVLIMFFSSLKLLKLYHCSQVLDGLMCTFCEIKETTTAVTRETVQVWMPCTRKVTLLFTRVVKGIDASASKTDTYSKGLFKKTLTYNLCLWGHAVLSSGVYENVVLKQKRPPSRS